MIRSCGRVAQSVGLVAVSLLLLVSATAACAQDASTGAIRGAILDPTGALIAGAEVIVTNSAMGTERKMTAGQDGEFAVQMLPPGLYQLRVMARKMSPWVADGIIVEVGGERVLECRMALSGSHEVVTVTASPQIVEPMTPSVSSVIDENAIQGLPINGRRFTDLALLTPGITQDPRSLTSATNGDLAFGGLRGTNTQYLVDGGDDNNSFYGQARGRYRAPYQFSNEVVQEFRISSNTYGAESGRSAGAVVNVVTKSGGNFTHGSVFYYLRDSEFGAQSPYVDFKPSEHQDQFGISIGGPIKKNRLFYYAAYDQHIFHVPTVVRFGANGANAVVTPASTDYDAGLNDYALVNNAASQLSSMGGTYRAAMIASTGSIKFDYTLSPRNQLSFRVNTSRYWGTNNVFFDPASPITPYAISDNGEEQVATETAMLSLISGLSFNTISHLRLQFSRDLQQSFANSDQPLTKVTGVTDGFGESTMLPRETREHKLHIAETISREGQRHSFKFGADFAPSWIYDYFPSMFGGEYEFSTIRVNPWTCLSADSVCQSQEAGVPLSPLEAYAHDVPRFYYQNFGSSVSHPNSNEYAAFAQDTLRATDHLALTLGARWDLQTFSTAGMASNPLWPSSGKMPFSPHNFAPRLGFAYSLGESHPLIVRGGYGWFYARIPQIYNSAVETENGLNNGHLSLDRGYGSYTGPLTASFPSYPAPLVNCAGATVCTMPASLQSLLATNNPGAYTSDISAFDAHFQTPMSQQASFSLEREIAGQFTIGAAYLYVHGEHLIRALDANLPQPTLVSYPVFDGNQFLNEFYTVESFSVPEMWQSIDCPWPPCVGTPQRPIPQLGSVTVFQSSAGSTYNGLTLSVRRRMSRGVYFRAAYTWAKAIDDLQDALVAGSPSLVQNSADPNAERGLSVTDQRQRFVLAWVLEPNPFHREHERLKRLFNDWRISSVTTIGSGRPYSATVAGDANADGNTENDRLPGLSRNSLVGPDYATTDLRLSRVFELHERWNLELLAEAFNLTNRDNRRITTLDSGSSAVAATFLNTSTTVSGMRYPAQFNLVGNYQTPTSSYAPRQVQLSARIRF